MAVTFEALRNDFYDTPFVGASGSDGWAHSGGNNVAHDYFNDPPNVGDTFEFRGPMHWSGVRLFVTTAMDGAPVIVWEYSRYNNVWSTLRVENGNAITTVATHDVKWTPPYNQNARISGARPGYRVRMRIAGNAGVTEGGANGGSKLQKLYHAFQVTGANQDMLDVFNHDQATPYVMLLPVTPAANLIPIECSFRKAEIVGKLDVILSGCTVDAGDNVVLTGIDFEDGALVETISVAASGTATYTTANCFKDVTDLTANGFNDGTISLQTQYLGQAFFNPGRFFFGISSNRANYTFFAAVIIGNDAAVTTFAGSEQLWTFRYMSTFFCVYGTNATLTLGNFDAAGDVQHSTDYCMVMFVDIAGQGGEFAAGLGPWVFQPRYLLATANATAFLYGTKFLAGSGTSNGAISTEVGATIHANEVSFNLRDSIFLFGSWDSTDGLWVRSLNTSFGFPDFVGADPERVVFNTDVNMLNNRDTRTLRNSRIESMSNFNNGFEAVRSWTFIDCPDFDDTDITFGGTNGFVAQGIFVQKTFNILVQDDAATPIVGATVEMRDQFGALVFSVVTGGTGEIAEQIVTWKQGAWVVPTGITWTNFTPHQVTITMAGYAPRVMTYTMDQARIEVEKLTLDGTNIQDSTFYDTTIY